VAFVLRDTRAQALIAAHGAPESAIAAARDCGVPVLTAVLDGADGDWSLASSSTLSAPCADGPPQPQDVALYLHTSGTTARPKLVPILHSSLMSSARNIARSYGLGPDDCSLCIMPLFHVHGLVASLLAPLTAGGRVWCAPGFQADRFFPWLRESGATWYTAVPSMHQAILLRSRHQSDLRKSHSLRFIRSCSAPLAPAVWTALRDTFEAPVIQAYGMTEAAHQISSSSLSDTPSEVGTVGTSTGPRIAIMDGAGNLQPHGSTGEVVLLGESIIRAYAAPPEANGTAFHDGWFRTGDEGYIDSAGKLRLTGRLKEMINAGGENVSPYEVEEALLSHPEVLEAVVFSIPHHLLGEAVASAIVCKPDAALTGPALRSWLRGKIAPHKIPKRIEIVGKLPLGATGKLQRIGMAARLGLAGSA
jgi:acyl-CoA synthetase (AMP-forming)/AMP-acid ligase II